jgi:hypothetical protein
VTLPSVLQRVVSILSEESVPYMVTGSFATAYYAHPRATQDIDLVVEASEDVLDRVAARLKEAGYYVSPEAVREAVAHEGQFNAIEPETGWKIDFIVRKSRPFSIQEFDRRTRVEVLGLELPLATAEDLVIAKLEWAKLGGSEIQLRDVQKIVRTRWEELDRPYLNHWIGELGLGDLWDRVTETIGSGPGDSSSA